MKSYHLFSLLLFSCIPLQVQHVPFSSEDYSSLDYHWRTSQKKPEKNNLCPLPFSQEELNEQLSKIICAAPDDFTDLKGDLDFEEDGYTYWKPKNISVSGARDIVMAKDNAGENGKKGIDFVVMFGCQDLSDPDQATVFFDEFREAISKVIPPCVTLKQKKLKENLADFLLKSVQWEGVVNSSTAGKVKVRVELDLNLFDGRYYSNVHVNIPNGN